MNPGMNPGAHPDMTPEAGGIGPDAVEAAGRVVGGRLDPSPCLRSAPLETVLRRPLWLKCELFQPTGSFKPRGALNWLANATEAERAGGLVAVSAGNHGMGLAWAAGREGVPVTVVMPEGSSPYKAEACRHYGAEVILHGDIHAAWRRARELVAERGATLVPPYDEPRIIAGQASVGLELQAQCPGLHTVLCPVGGGGLICGLGLALKAYRPDVRIVGVEPAGAPTLGAAWDAGRPVTLEGIDTIAASLGANRAGEHTYAISREVVDDLVTVDDDSIVAAARAVITEGKLYAEPGAVLGVAALMDGTVRPPAEAGVATVITGGNLDRDLLYRLLERAG